MCPLICSMSKSKAILIIDGARQNIQLLGSILENEGYVILVATSGLKALEIVRSSQPPDLIMLDITTPDIDSYEVCRLLKAGSCSNHIPVIFISSIDDTKHKLMAFRAGAVDYISWPFQSEEVVARVHNHLQLATIDELRNEIAERKLTEEALWNSQDKLNAMTAELGLVEERERRRITQALHDQVVHKLAAGKLMLDQALKKGDIPSETAVSELQGIMDGSMRDLNDLSADLSSHILYRIGLKSAIESMGKELAGEHCFRFTISGDEAFELQEDLRVTLFQMVRELLINVVKHAGASAVAVKIAMEDESVSLEIIDDGAGFDFPSRQEGFGLVYIRQRVSFLGGAMKVDTAPGIGTRIVITLSRTSPS